MTDLATLGDKDWRFTVKSEQLVNEPNQGIIFTGSVPHYGRDVIVFFPVGRQIPEVGKTVNIRIQNGKLIYPVPERQRTS